MRDEGRPLGADDQELASNPPRAAVVKSDGGEIPPRDSLAAYRQSEIYARGAWSWSAPRWPTVKRPS